MKSHLQSKKAVIDATSMRMERQSCGCWDDPKLEVNPRKILWVLFSSCTHWYLPRIPKLCICHIQYLYQLEGFPSFRCTSLYRSQSRHWRSIVACGWLPVYKFKGEKSVCIPELSLNNHSFIRIYFTRQKSIQLPNSSLREALNFRSLKQQPTILTGNSTVEFTKDCELLHPLVILIDLSRSCLHIAN
jgi:hypothetical protein